MRATSEPGPSRPQVFILDSLATYAAADDKEAEKITERVAPRLQHANCAVVLSAVKVRPPTWHGLVGRLPRAHQRRPAARQLRGRPVRSQGAAPPWHQQGCCGGCGRMTAR